LSTTESPAPIAPDGRRAGLRSIVAVALVITASCAPAPPGTVTSATDNTAVQRAFERHAENLELTATGSVDRVLSDQEGPSGPHERFVVRLPDVGLTVLVEHNLSIAPRVPVSVGQPIVVRGEYVWNTQGGFVHFTHHDPDGSHEAGYILYGGRRYD